MQWIEFGLELINDLQTNDLPSNPYLVNRRVTFRHFLGRSTSSWNRLDHHLIFLRCIDGSCSVDHIKCSLVTPVSRQMHSDGY